MILEIAEDLYIRDISRNTLLEKEENSSLGIRLLFSMLLFLVFVFAERYNESLYLAIVECIMGR